MYPNFVVSEAGMFAVSRYATVDHIGRMFHFDAVDWGTLDFLVIRLSLIMLDGLIQ